MVSRNLRQTHLQEVGLMQIPAYHVNVTAIGREQGPPQLPGHGHGLVCEVILRLTNFVCLAQH